MINFNDITRENIREHKSHWQQIHDHPCRILMVRSSGSGKANALLNLISHQPDIDKIYLCPKNRYEAKYQFFINKLKGVGLKHCNDSKAFIEYSNDMSDIYENIEQYNPYKERKILNVFNDMITGMLSDNKKVQQIVVLIFVRVRKLNISLLFITKYYFAVPKNVRLNSTY